MSSTDLPVDGLESAEALGVVRVLLKEVQHLPKMDVLGSCDAYAVASVGSKQKFRTTVVWNLYLATWNKSFEFTVGGTHGEVLRVDIYDKDMFTQDDFIGFAEFNLRGFVYGDSAVSPFSVIEQTVYLRSRGGQFVTGQDGQFTALVLLITAVESAAPAMLCIPGLQELF